MNIFIIISVAVPILVYFLLPSFLEVLAERKPVSRNWLVIAGALFFISWYLPSPLIMGEETSFTTHFVGGGLFTAAVWMYVRKQMGWKFSPLRDLVGLYLLVSALGAANELFELLIWLSGRASLSSNDTWWDLFANTLGVLLCWLVMLGKHLLSEKASKHA